MEPGIVEARTIRISHGQEAEPTPTDWVADLETTIPYGTSVIGATGRVEITAATPGPTR